MAYGRVSNNKGEYQYMTEIQNIINSIDAYAPKDLAEEWDHIGLMVGDSGQKVSKVLLALDVTQRVAEEAVAMGCQLIVSHHPFLFHSLQSIDLSTPKGRTIAYLLQHGVTVYSAHTNLDYATQGVNDVLYTVAEKNAKNGRICLQQFAQNMKKELNAPMVRVYAPKERLQEPVGSLAVACGAFDGDVSKVLKQQAKVLVTGEIKYNQAVDLMEWGICVVEAGHYDTEKIVLPHLQTYLSAQHVDVEFYLTSTRFEVSIVP